MKTKKHEFYVNAVWDEEANVFYSKSNIKGLHIEADTIEEFSDLVKEFAPELIFNNHFKTEYMQNLSAHVQKTPAHVQKTPARVQKIPARAQKIPARAQKKSLHEQLVARLSPIPPVAQDTLIATA